MKDVGRERFTVLWDAVDVSLVEKCIGNRTPLFVHRPLTILLSTTAHFC